MSNYISFAIKHDGLNLGDKEKCFSYCESLYRKFVDIYSKFGKVTYYIDEEYYEKYRELEFTVKSDDEFIATVEVFSDFVFIDPFFDDWELLYTPYVANDARRMMQIFVNDIKEIWYFNDESVMPVGPHGYPNFKEFLDVVTTSVGGHIPVLNTEKLTIDGVPYIPSEMQYYDWIAFYERFE